MEAIPFESTAEAWLFAVVALVLGFGGLWAAPRVWQDRVPLLRRLEAPPFWIFPEAIWRGFLRIAACNAVGFGVIFVVGGVEVLFSDPGLLSTALAGSATARLVIAMIAFLITVPLDIALVGWARPRGLVPPHLRHLPGAVAEWRGAPWRQPT
jgi:hypothetical protein